VVLIFEFVRCCICVNRVGMIQVWVMVFLLSDFYSLVCLLWLVLVLVVLIFLLNVLLLDCERLNLLFGVNSLGIIVEVLS